MRKMINNDRNKKKFVAVAAAAITVILIVNVGTIGGAPFSNQQPQGGGSSDRTTGPRITSANIVDETIVSADLQDGAAVRSNDIVEGQVDTSHLAEDAVTSEKIRDGEVKIDDLDPAIDIGGGSTPAFTLQVTQRSEEIIVGGGLPNIHRTVSCNDDEQVVGGGFQTFSLVSISRQNVESNGWEVRIQNPQSGFPHQIYAECAKIVPAS
jgi:hypothetical protein